MWSTMICTALPSVSVVRRVVSWITGDVVMQSHAKQSLQEPPLLTHLLRALLRAKPLKYGDAEPRD